MQASRWYSDGWGDEGLDSTPVTGRELVLHMWGCWSHVGLLVTGGAAGHTRGCWSQVGLLVLVPGADVTALVLAAGAGAGAWCWRLALVPGASVRALVHGAGGWRWCWCLVLALVMVPGAGMTALVPVLVLVPGAGGWRWCLVLAAGAGAGAGAWCWRLALVLVPGADGAGRVGRAADGLQAGWDLTVGGAQVLVRSPVRRR
ncbi:unnamed protein product [Closterium sp. NIES-64]|nr:unnamed protein product [Closterium sp. NIES-64]